MNLNCARARPARGPRSGCLRPAVRPGRARPATQAAGRAWCYRPYVGEPPTRAAAARLGQVTARAGRVTQPARLTMVCQCRKFVLRFRVRLADPGPAADSEFSAHDAA